MLFRPQKDINSLLEEKVLYRTVFGTPKRFHTLLKKGFLWVLYRTLGFRIWPIEPFIKRGMEPFLVLNRTISAKSVHITHHFSSSLTLIY